MVETFDFDGCDIQIWTMRRVRFRVVETIWDELAVSGSENNQDETGSTEGASREVQKVPSAKS